MKKKVLAGLLITALAIPLFVIGAFANTPVAVPGDRPAIVIINGENQTLDTPTLWKNGKTLLPVRDVVEKMGLHIHYVAATRSIYVVDSEGFTPNATAELAEESFNFFRNNVKHDVNFEIVENKALVAADQLAEVLGQYYYEDVKTNSVYYFDGNAEMKDGVYTTVGLYSTNRNRLPKLELTVKNGKIDAVVYDEYDMESGLGKSNPEYGYNWEILLEAIPGFSAELVEKQDPGLVDLVTSATSTHHKFVELSKKAMAKAMYSNVAEARMVELGGEVVNGYRDGTYRIVGLASGDWTSIVDMKVEDGKIVYVNYDSYMENGESKKEHGGKNDAGVSYVERWSNARNVDPVAIIAERERQLIDTQDPNLVDVATGATSWGHDLKRYASGALYHAMRADVEVNDDSVIYVFIGDTTANSAYYVQLLAVAENNEVKEIDYIEFQRGNPLAKQHNPTYSGPEGRWYTNFAETTLAGRAQLDILADMIEYSMENQSYELDVITGATNWGKGLQQLVPRAFDIIESK
ncbi:stalk domain-containing protein [Alkaliphilus peptidifermentans]|uniref:Major membrane immunogen, membrane-anchored lipoprotein n=1 Tax=Alkaliphilus peptidifermentans DSM 18978 TaxID=1120976 RepID=A0A1G5HPZ7_9FIRM|nr:stalk domain-containing protein [Alkaliphilus peptidifermentans]SCY65817.1 Major membrane immunogen, membrane-anchored lipoprotein [Alkaliphilus peptidifermentans DSM 18978]